MTKASTSPIFLSTFSTNAPLKPEFLQWQIFFSSFYAENNRGDNTLENARYYTNIRTASGKNTINKEWYDSLLASGLDKRQIDAILNGEKGASDNLTDEQKKALYNFELVDGNFKPYIQPQYPKNIKLGVSIPIKTIIVVIIKKHH